MEPTDPTLRVLQEIRDEQRATRQELRESRQELQQELRAMNEQMSARFEVVETTLRDLAEQRVMLARGIRSALDARADVDKRLPDVERRLGAIEKPPH